MMNIFDRRSRTSADRIVGRPVSAILLVTVLCAAWSASAAVPAGAQRYTVTLEPGQTLDGARAVAEELTGRYGGTVAEAGGDTFTVLLPSSRARLLGADPRVKAIVAAAPRPMANAVAANAAVPEEPVQWAAGVSVTYDAKGNVRQMGADSFAYDHAGRLIKAQVNGVVRTYEYDAYGNRQKCTQNPNTATVGDCQPGLTVNSNDNRIIQATYDPSGKGNVVALGGNSYSYDAVDMMTRAVTLDGPREYLYTAGDQRLATYAVNSQSWRWTVRDVSGKVLREFTSRDGATFGSASFQWAGDNVWRKSELLATLHPVGGATVRYHYHLDHLGTPRRITDDRDNIVGFHDYLAFGPEVSGGLHEPSASPLKYTGHERDSSSDPDSTLDYMHARYYSPMLGRFLSADRVMGKAEMPQTWNLFAYARNNPLAVMDPDGNEGVHVINAFPRGDVDRGIERGVQNTLTNAGINYYRADAMTQQQIVDVLSDSTNDVIVVGHGEVSALGQPSRDVLLTPHPNLLTPGVGNQIQARSLSLVACASMRIPIPNGTPGAVLTNYSWSNRMMIFAQALALQQQQGVELPAATEQAETTANTTTEVDATVPQVHATTRDQANREAEQERLRFQAERMDRERRP